MAFTWTQKSKERQIDINWINKRVFQLIAELSYSIAELSNSIGKFFNSIIELLIQLQSSLINRRAISLIEFC